MRILLTGAQGYLGRTVWRALASSGATVVPVGRRAEAGVVRCDLEDATAVRAMVAETAPDRILHAAAFVPATLAAYHEPESVTRNVGMVRALLNAGPVPVVYVSSMTVYGSEGAVLRRENDAGRPENAYGESKWRGERIIADDGRSGFAVRIPGLFGGARQGGLVGNLLSALRADEVPSLPDRPILWAAMHVEDAARGIARLAMQPIDGFTPVNLGYADTCSISRLVTLAADMAGQPVDYAQAQPDFAFDLTLARHYDIAPSGDLRTALNRLMREMNG